MKKTIIILAIILLMSLQNAFAGSGYSEFPVKQLTPTTGYIDYTIPNTEMEGTVYFLDNMINSITVTSLTKYLIPAYMIFFLYIFGSIFGRAEK